MDQCICNMCYCTQDKVKRPLELTQCGHIFCHNCLKQIKNICSECKSKEIKSVSLAESLAPELSKLFIPLSDVVTAIKSLVVFQTEQRNIILECFYQIDDKYRMLKYRYISAVQSKKKITCDYSNLKKSAEGLRKKLMFMEMNSINTKQNIVIQSSSSRYGTNKIYNVNTSESKLYRR